MCHSWPGNPSLSLDNTVQQIRPRSKSNAEDRSVP